MADRHQAEAAGIVPSGEPSAAAVADASRLVREYFHSPGYKAKDQFFDKVDGLPDLGTMKLSLTEAADLVAADVWLSDENRTGGFDFEEIQRSDPALLEHLKQDRERLVGQLITSVEAGELKNCKLRRQLRTNAINPDETYVECDDLREWLKVRGYKPGDWFSEYQEEEGGIWASLIDELHALRSMYSPIVSDEEARLRLEWRRQQEEVAFGFATGLPTGVAPENVGHGALHQIIKGLSVENARLKRELAERENQSDARALTPKSRRTLHRLIAALCLQAGIDPAERAAAATLAAVTQRAGHPVGDDTIRSVLKELPEVDRNR